jgi:hypothetical protein
MPDDDDVDDDVYQCISDRNCRWIRFCIVLTKPLSPASNDGALILFSTNVKHSSSYPSMKQRMKVSRMAG